VDVELDTTPVTAVVDRGQLAEVLVNLVSNAYEAMTDGGVLTIAAHATGSSVLLAVEDTGCGFDRADAERLFEPFFTTKSSGTGLGLAIVRRLLEVNGAEISVDSHPGRGTRFTLTFPVRFGGLRRTPVPGREPSPNGAASNGTSSVAGTPRARRTP
jgi:signal transduction histidine kinase